MYIKYHIYIFVVAAMFGSYIFGADLGSNEIVRVKSYSQDASFKDVSTDNLRRELEKNRSLIGMGQENRGKMRKLRVELARRGDEEARKQIFTALHSNDLLEQSNALVDTALLGDKEAVYHLAEMLNDPNPGGRITYRTPDGKVVKSNDEGVRPPRIVAAKKLAALVDNPPVPPIGGTKKYYTEEDVQKWREWWQANSNRYCNPRSNEVIKAKTP